jgi:hypothetical protein
MELVFSSTFEQVEKKPHGIVFDSDVRKPSKPMQWRGHWFDRGLSWTPSEDNYASVIFMTDRILAEYTSSEEIHGFILVGANSSGGRGRTELMQQFIVI